MKMLLFFSILLSSIFLSAEERVMVKASGCSDYLFASNQEHESSAVEDYRYEASSKCADKGYGNWTTLTSNWTPGVGVPRFCIRGKVRCHD